MKKVDCKSLGAVRERERERELHFSEIKGSFTFNGINVFFTDSNKSLNF